MNGTDIKTLSDSYGEETVAELVKNYKVMKFLADNAVEKTAGAEEGAEGETAAAETTPANATAAEETTQAQTESNAQ